MTISDVPAQARLQLGQGPLPGRRSKQHTMDVFRGVAAGFAHDYPLAVLIPLEHRTGTNTEALSHLRRNRHLSLSRDLGRRQRHALYYHGNATTERPFA